MSCPCKETVAVPAGYVHPDQLQAARDAVIEAAKGLRNHLAENKLMDLRVAVERLCKLEQPADPLEPVREFVRFAQEKYLFGDTPYAKKLKAAAKALGMEENK